MLGDAFYSTLRRIERHVGAFLGALTAFLTVGLVIALGCVAIFAIIANGVHAGVTQGLDENVLRWLAARRTPVLNQVMLEITTLGTTAVITVVVLTASAFLWHARDRWAVYVLLLGTATGMVLNGALKHYFERPRPSVVQWATTVHTTSFPSGHAMTSLIAYGAIALMLARLRPTPRLKRTTWLLTALLILIIGVSRMYLGVHYPSDVIAGYIAGLAWLAFLAALSGRRHARTGMDTPH